MTEPRDIASAFAELAQIPPADAGKPAHFSRLLRHCLHLTEAAAANIITADGGGLRASQATTAAARELLDLELEAGSGPGLDCVRDGASIGPVCIAEPSRWPHIVVAAQAAGYHTAHAHPMRPGRPHAAEPIGALVVYTRSPLGVDDRIIAQALADSAAAAIVTARALDGQTARATQLQQALNSRIVIEQAKGVLAERHHIRPDAAFTLLRERARNSNEKIHAVATAVIESAQR